MGQGQAHRDEVDVLTEDVERLRRRGQSLTSELLDRAQPPLKRVRELVQSMHDRPGLWKMLLLSPLVIGGVVTMATCMVAGAMIQRSRHRRRLRKNAVGRLLLAVTD